eukprot:779006-Prymnesium_polylepis.1
METYCRAVDSLLAQHGTTDDDEPCYAARRCGAGPRAVVGHDSDACTARDGAPECDDARRKDRHDARTGERPVLSVRGQGDLCLRGQRAEQHAAGHPAADDERRAAGLPR